MPIDPAWFPDPPWPVGARVRFTERAVGFKTANRHGTGTVLYEWLGIEPMVTVQSDDGPVLSLCVHVGDTLELVDG